jgi:hypothetical protein
MRFIISAKMKESGILKRRRRRGSKVEVEVSFLVV